MSSLIISRIILAAFLALSLSACSKGGKSAATVKKGSGQQAGARKSGVTNIDVDEGKTKNPSEKDETDQSVDKSKTSKNEDLVEEESDELEDDKKVVAPISGVSVKPIISSVKPNTSSSNSVSTVSAVNTQTQQKAPSVYSNSQPSAVSKTNAKPVQAAVKNSSQSVEKAQTVNKAPVIKNSEANQAWSNDNVSAPKVASAVIKSGDTWAASTTASNTTDVITEKATAKSETEKTRDANLDQVVEQARREIVVKNQADLDRDDTSKENIGSAAYKAVIDQLLSRIDLNAANTQKSIVFPDKSYYESKYTKVAGLPSSMMNKIHASSACSIEYNRGCLVVEVSIDRKVVGSYIGFRIEEDPASPGRLQSVYYRTFINDINAQKDLEMLSRVAAGKTVVFTNIREAFASAENSNQTAEIPKVSSAPTALDLGAGELNANTAVQAHKN